MIEHAKMCAVSEIGQPQCSHSCVLGCIGLQCSRNYLELSKSSWAALKKIGSFG